jgi:hypothetical protein
VAGKRINMIMQADVLQAVDAAARHIGISRSRFINVALVTYLETAEEASSAKRVGVDKRELRRAEGAVEEIGRFLDSIRELKGSEEQPMH